MDGSKPTGNQNKRGGTKASLEGYRLEDQVGFVIRKASQRHTAIFMKQMIEQLTPNQWAALLKIAELGSVSQNQLGRDTAMDVATIKGVVDRLIKRDFVTTNSDPSDSRRNLIGLTPRGAEFVKAGRPIAASITGETLKGLSAAEQHTLLELLRKIA